jgi:hypothetical protein
MNDAGASNSRLIVFLRDNRCGVLRVTNVTILSLRT